MQIPKIVRVPVLPFGMVNCHLLIGAQGAILVDSGVPGSEPKVERVLKRNNLSFSDLKLIVITHAHTDHAGSAARLRTLSGAPIVGHIADLPYYVQEKPMTFCTTGPFGRFFVGTGLPSQPYEAFTPDILLKDEDQFDLRPYGIEGTVHHTPGHTAGSISIHLANKEAMVGDLIASGILLGGIVLVDRPTRPPFEDDPHAVAAQLENLLQAGMERFHMGHGGPLKVAAVKEHIISLRALPARTAK